MKVTQSSTFDNVTPVVFGKSLSKNEQKDIKGGGSHTLDCHIEYTDCGSGLISYVCCPDPFGNCEAPC